MTIPDAIRALSDTDALAEYVEAKDAEIARLREALKKIRDENQLQDENRYWEMRDGYYAQIARAALAEDDTPGEKERK
jgi:gamma-glutamyl:cysteine ligase YbdK (ATP-grasp superfamily)